MPGPGRTSHFDAVADRYDAARPGYPPALFDALAGYAGLAPGSRVLEIAPGTGQATVPMAGRGWVVTAVELGPRMAAAARRRLAAFPSARVEVAAFEDWELPAEPFDTVVCATAFHWLDPAVRLAKPLRALRPGGALAVVVTHHVAGGSTAFFTAAQRCYETWDPSTPPDLRLPGEDTVGPSLPELDTAAGYGDVQRLRVVDENTWSTAGYLDLVSTFSPTIALSPDQRAGLLRCLGELIDTGSGGRVTKRTLLELVLARRVG